ncbi:phosphomannomutase/phosphoglucomutase [Candidatus Babeliales bacterium]|nr:phosphomannomutase/phosphoglucomutase [Candidatus Babeliales bacterium]
MKNNIFKKNDIRGVVEEEFSIDDAGTIAKAIITYFLQKNKTISTVIVGMDRRTHSPQIKKTVIEAIIDMGVNVIDIGLCPTPVFYFSLFNIDKANSGFMITASHNPKEYNGFKICLEQKSVWGKQIQEIKHLCYSNEFYQKPHSKKGTIKKWNAVETYINWLEQHFSHLKNLSIPAVIDCESGTASIVIPKLIEKMNWETRNPLFRIDFDADCDRISLITKDGESVASDKLLAIYAKQVLLDNPEASVVFDIKSSQGLIDELKKMGAKDIISPSGHSIIKDVMRKNNSLLAGELSGHFFFKHRYFGYDDGIYAMMRLFEILHQTNKSLETLLSTFPPKVSSPEYRIACEEEKKETIVEDVKNYFINKTNAKTITIDGIRAQLDYGWGLVRASNTQPVISLRFESDSEEGLQRIKNDFVKVLLPYFEEGFLKKELEC